MTCTSRRRPAREEMTRLEGDESREIRAALVGHVLLVDVWERYDVAAGSDWERDREAGVALSGEGVAALRALLGLSPPTTPGSRILGPRRPHAPTA